MGGLGIGGRDENNIGETDYVIAVCCLDFRVFRILVGSLLLVLSVDRGMFPWVDARRGGHLVGCKADGFQSANCEVPLVILVGLQVRDKVCASGFHRYICMLCFLKA